MNDKVLSTLEFDKILKRLGDKCYSDKAREASLSLRPYDSIVKVETAQSETEEALKYIFSRGSLSLRGVREVKPSVKRAVSGGALSIRELLNIALLLEIAARVKKYPGETDNSRNVLSDRFEGLTPAPALVKSIRECIVDEETIADDASPELSSLRRKKKKAADSIHTTLQNLIRGQLKSYLMEPVITMRGDRYCVPVKVEYRTTVSGMVHDMSSTGSTVFIEPAAVVELNNSIRQYELEEKAEIDRILMRLTEKCAEEAEFINADQDVLTELDIIFARAELALEMNAQRPVFNTGEIIQLRQARHPLLDAKKAVPIDICLGESFDLLIVTGPNTGGKTVALKTVGLLELMGLSGLHIPAADRSELSFFKEIYADIGDEQSIEQSLSTFSSHITNVVKILHDANITSLCLFDELGAGTDPTEGAALAEAVLSYLHKRSIRTIATTHYAELKEYALTTNWVENACCEFDVATLRPTYRILVGVPGKSNAFVISQRLGMPEHIIKNAEKLMNEEDKRLENLMSNLEESRQELEKEKRELEKQLNDTKSLNGRLRSKENKLEESREKLLAKAREEAKELLSEAKETADETIKHMQKYASADMLREAEKARTKVRESLKKATGTAKHLKDFEEENPEAEEFGGARAKGHRTLTDKDIKIGDEVRIVSQDLKGMIKSLPDKKGFLSVQCGIMNNRVHISDLILSGQSAKSSSVLHSLGHTKSISPELMLIGMTADEARASLEAYLDDAYLSHIGQVRIVHGKGSGILRDMVHSYVRKVKYVSEYRLGEFGEGDSGVTIIRFKD